MSSNTTTTNNNEETTHPLDQPELLSKWGFQASACQRCGLKNSQLQGKLLQCGKCKKAYYCSKLCFNQDLTAHQKFCSTERLE